MESAADDTGGQSMSLFDRKNERTVKATTPTTDGSGKDNPGSETGVERLGRQLEEERRQRLEDVRKERAERLAAQEELRRMRAEYYRLLREVEERRLEAQRLRAARRGFFGSLFEGRQGEDASDGR